MRVVVGGRFRLGNEILKTIASVWLAETLGVQRLEGVWLPEFGLETPIDGPLDRCPAIGMDNAQRHRLEDIAAIAADGRHDGIVNWTLGQRMEYLDGQRDAWREVLARPTLPVAEAGPDEIAIHVRADDVLALNHRGYFPLPFEFYDLVIRETGLRPLFVGLLEDPHPYLRELRERYPGARFVSGSVPEDFELIRRAATKVLSISTFAWVAAWLGGDGTRVIQPIAGLYDPLLWPDIDLLPVDDPRFEFRRFASLEVAPGQGLEEFHRLLAVRSCGFPKVTPLVPPRMPARVGRSPSPAEWRDIVRACVRWG